MGTRSITTVRSRWNREDEFQLHATIYRHYDGYIDGHGAWLYDHIKDLKVVNGKLLDAPDTHVNGPGSLATRIVCDLEREGYEPMLMLHGANCGQEYHYQIDVEYGAADWKQRGAPLIITVFDGPVTMFGAGGDECTRMIFNGTVEQFGKFVKGKVKA